LVRPPGSEAQQLRLECGGSRRPPVHPTPLKLSLEEGAFIMVEFQPFGPKLPHAPEGILEHERDVREEAEHVHDVKRASEAEKPWWAFWRRNRRPTGSS
jgi:hypothetical protein